MDDVALSPCAPQHQRDTREIEAPTHRNEKLLTVHDGTLCVTPEISEAGLVDLLFYVVDCFEV